MVWAGPTVGLIGQLALLAALAGTAGLGGAGWTAGVAFGIATSTALARGLARSGVGRLGPADRVTLVRATLVGGVTALVAESFTRPLSVPTVVALTVVALLLDAVDGWVARRTGTSSRLGSRFDQEVDAFLILVLSVCVAVSTTWWALAIGLARYAFAAGGWLLPWLRRALPPRYWGKVVAAVQGITLTVAVADVLPRSWTLVALAASSVLLAESFAHSVWWLWRRRGDAVEPTSPAATSPAATSPAATSPVATSPVATSPAATSPAVTAHLSTGTPPPSPRRGPPGPEPPP